MQRIKFLSIVPLLFGCFLIKGQNSSKKSLDQVDSLLNHAVIIINENALSANENMTTVIEISQVEGWEDKKAYGLMYRGISFFYLGNYPEALNDYLRSKALFDSLGLAQGQAKINNELGVFFSKQENFEEAYKYYESARSIAEPNDLNQELAVSFSNQGQSYFKRGMYGQSFPLMIKALKIKEAIGDSVGVGYELKRLAAYYFVKEDFKQGLVFLERSNAIRRRLGDKKGLAINVVTRAEMFQQRKRYEQAISAYLETLQLSKEIGYVDLTRYVYGMLEQCYLSLNDYNKAYENQKQSQALSDSLLTSSKVEAIAEMQTKYETAQKEEKIANQQLDLVSKEAAIKNQKYQIYALIAGLLIVGLGIVIFYSRYKSKQQLKLQAAVLAEKERGFESILSATEEERSRISKELHDGIGQQLGALKLGLQNVSKSISDDQQKSALEKITDSFSKSAEDVRHISHQMMPRALMEKGLVEAIEDLLQASFQYTDTTYTFEHHNVHERLSERIEVSVYRVVQELINNIIKHANASEVSMQLVRQKNNLVVFLEDNGKGMGTCTTEGHGLLNIKSRIDMVNGSVNFAPSENSGTSVTIRIPLSL